MALRDIPHEEGRRGLRRYVLRFARELGFAAVLEFVASLSGAAPETVGRRAPTFVFDIEATPQGLRHCVSVDAGLDDYLTAQIGAHLPRTRVTATSSGTQHWDAVTRLTRPRISSKGRIAAPEAAITTLLSALSPVRAEEALLVRWVARSSAPSARPFAAAGRAAVTDESSFVATGYIAARAADRAGARRLIGRVFAALTSVDPATLVFEASAASQELLGSRQLPLRGGLRPPSVYSVREFSVLIGFPAVTGAVEGLPRSPSRQLRPDAALPAEGLVLGVSNFPGVQRPIALSPADLLMHLWLIGKTGSGKSTVMQHLAVQLAALGFGLLVIEPKGDLVRAIATTLPAARRADVKFFDPSDRRFPIGLNVLRGGDPEWITAQIVALFKALYGDSWGPRLEYVLRHAVLTAARAGLSLYDVKLLLVHERYRRKVVASLTDGELREFWRWYEHAADNVADSVLNKLDGFLGYSVIRNIVGQLESGIDIGEVVRDGQILLVPLAEGLIGDANAAMLSALVLGQVWDAVRARAAIPTRRRRPFFVLVDEFQQFARLPVALGDALAQARGYGMGMVLANQHLAQLSADLRAAVMTNGRSKIAFAAGADDARVLAREFAPDVDATDLQTLGRFEAIAHLLADGTATAPVTIETLPPLATVRDGSDLRDAARARYGRPVADVERELAGRLGDRDDRNERPAVGREQ